METMSLSKRRNVCLALVLAILMILSSSCIVMSTDEESDGAVSSQVYTVFFHGNGGTNDSNQSEAVFTIHGGQTIQLPVTMFQKPGAYPYGWNEGSTSGTLWDAGESYTINDDVHFYANWTALTVGGDHVTEADIVVNIGETKTYTPFTGKPDGTQDPWWGWQYDDYSGQMDYDVTINTIHEPSWVTMNRTPGSFPGFSNASLSFEYQPTAPGNYVVEYELKVVSSPGGTITSHVGWIVTVPSAMDTMYTVSYDSNGGTVVGDGLASDSQPGYTVVTLPDEGDARLSNNTLLGWTIPVNGEPATFAPGGQYTLDPNDGDVEAVAYWLPGNYVVIYNPLNAAGVRGESYSAGDVIELDTSAGDGVEAPNGTRFGGWFNNGNESVILTPGMSYEVDGKIKLTGYWIPTSASTYTVTFDANGGSTPDLTVDVVDGKAVLLPEHGFERSGYTFAGWSESPNGTVLNEETYTPDSDQTLYAQWVQNTVPVDRVQFTSGSSLVYTNNTITISATAYPSNASERGVTFGITDGDGTVLKITSQRTTASGGSVTVMGISPGTATLVAYANDGSGKTASRTITVVAEEHDYTHTLIYNLNGGFTGPGIDSRNTGSVSSFTFTISDEVPTYPGYTFKGWAQTENGDPEYGWLEGLKTTITVSGEKTLYAIWEEIPVEQTHTLNYRTNGGNWDNGSLIDIETIVDTSETVEFTIRDDHPTRLGWAFVGWSTDPDTSPDDEENILVAGDKFSVNKTDDLYAIWDDQRNVFRVVYDANFGDEDSIPEPWEDRSSSTLYIYNIDFDTTPTRDGCAFLGWSESPSATTPEYRLGGDTVLEIRLLGDNVNGPEVRLYAIWGVFEGIHILEFDPMGGEFETTQLTSPETQEDSYTFDIPQEIPVKAGYDFNGWSTDPDAFEGTYRYGTENDSITVSVKETLYAIWTPDGSNNYLEIVYSLNGGSGNFPSEMYDGPLTSYEFDITDLKPVKGESRFLGWDKDPNSKTAEFPYGQNNTLIVTVDDPSIILYAVWRDVPEGSFIVTFDSNGGSSVVEQIVTSGGLATEPKDPVRNGHEFLGWFTADMVGFDFDTKITADITLYALWGEAGDAPEDSDVPLPLIAAIAAGVIVVLLGLVSKDWMIAIVGVACAALAALTAYFL